MAVHNIPQFHACIVSRVAIHGLTDQVPSHALYITPNSCVNENEAHVQETEAHYKGPRQIYTHLHVRFFKFLPRKRATMCNLPGTLSRHTWQ